ncbi:MAG: DegT/DnrJ/EryC1/StrS family aminotransferase [Polyangiaceae bacterium]
MSRTVPFYRHQLGAREAAAVAAVLETLFLTTGPKTKELEESIAKRLGVGHALGMTSATTALHLALVALGVGPGDEVIVPAMTFIATSNVVLHCGATPVFVDVEADTGNIDLAAVERAITPKTKAIIPVHLYGQMVDMKRLSAIAEKRTPRVHVIEDCAHAFESERDGVKPGQLSDGAAFSFYATKNVTSGEGGALAMRDTAFFEKVRTIRLHGMSAAAYDRHTGVYRHWDMIDLGFKANMGDIQAALILPQLPDVEAKNERRKAIAAHYDRLFEGAKDIGHPTTQKGVHHAHHLYTVWVPPARRDEVLHKLQQRGVGVAVNYRAVHLLTYYREKFGFERGRFPEAERIGDSTISLPMYPTLSEEDVEYVASTLKAILAEAP